jgi:hypothetical protein
LAASKKRGFVLLTNIGLNYNDMDQYAEDMPKYLNWLLEIAKSPSKLIPDLTGYPGSGFSSPAQLSTSHSKRRRKIIDVLWRETSAAHWSYTANGYFNHQLHRESNLSLSQIFCAPHSNSKEGYLDPRNQVVIEFIAYTFRVFNVLTETNKTDNEINIFKH